MTIKLPPLPEPDQWATFATAENTKSVRDGLEMGGYEKTPPRYNAETVERLRLEAIEAYKQQTRSDAEKLATAIADAATKAGVTDSSEHSFCGPQLLMLLDDLVEMATRGRKKPLFGDMINQHPGLVEELKTLDEEVDRIEALSDQIKECVEAAPALQPLSDEQLDSIIKGCALEGYALIQVSPEDLTCEEFKRVVRAWARAVIKAAHGIGGEK